MALYKWKIRIILKSGVELTTYYLGIESDSEAVASKLLVGDLDCMIGLGAENSNENIFIKRGDISAALISIAKR